MHNLFAGLGSLSPTLNRARIMTISEKQWLGEEQYLEEMPVIYDAVAVSEVVRVLRISLSSL